jgi:hypothetical protein
MNFYELLVITGAFKSNLSQHLSMMVLKSIPVQRKDILYSYFKISDD